MTRRDLQLIVTITPTAKASAAWDLLYSRLLSADAWAPEEPALGLQVHGDEEPKSRLVGKPKMKKEPGGQDGRDRRL